MSYYLWEIGTGGDSQLRLKFQGLMTKGRISIILRVEIVTPDLGHWKGFFGFAGEWCQLIKTSWNLGALSFFSLRSSLLSSSAVFLPHLPSFIPPSFLLPSLFLPPFFSLLIYPTYICQASPVNKVLWSHPTIWRWMNGLIQSVGWVLELDIMELTII